MSLCNGLSCFVEKKYYHISIQQEGARREERPNSELHTACTAQSALIAEYDVRRVETNFNMLQVAETPESQTTLASKVQ